MIGILTTKLLSFTHLIYFGSVFVEGHGVYAWAGGVLLILGVMAMFIKEGGYPWESDG